MYILGIESSCDDTSISIVKDGKEILSNVVFSQIKKHEKYFGVVPEIASREHLKIIDFVFNEAIKLSNIPLTKIDAIAVTNYPGLIGSLIVGVNFAKGLSISLGKPLIAVNHLIAHIYSSFLSNDIEFPIIALLISGGHTAIIRMNDFFDYEIIGKTIDDATGEAFDKVSKYFELGYPGGPIIDKLSKYGNKDAYSFPVPLNNLKKYGLNFSFSGIKTAVMYHREKYKNTKIINTNQNENIIEKKQNENIVGNKQKGNIVKKEQNKNIDKKKIDLSKDKDEFYYNMILKQKYLKSVKKLGENENLFDIAASFQNTIAKTLYLKVNAALKQNPDIKNIVVAGGASANSKVRELLSDFQSSGFKVHFPPLNLCMDNGAMVAGIAYHYYNKKIFADLTLNPFSRIKTLKRGTFI